MRDSEDGGASTPADRSIARGRLHSAKTIAVMSAAPCASTCRSASRTSTAVTICSAKKVTRNIAPGAVGDTRLEFLGRNTPEPDLRDARDAPERPDLGPVDWRESVGVPCCREARSGSVLLGPRPDLFSGCGRVARVPAALLPSDCCSSGDTAWVRAGLLPPR